MKAKLFLANGDTISLQNIKDGLEYTQGVYKVLKNTNDLYYKQNGNPAIAQALFNTVTTYNGCHLRVIFLDDDTSKNTTINMNVASTLQFGVSSVASARNVTIKGEALFDIMHYQNIPYVVTIPSARPNGRTGKIEVMGTSFNVNANEDENDRKITLVRGKVKVMAVPVQEPATISETDYKPFFITLTEPGDQAQMQDNGKIKVVHDVNIDEVVEWKSGSVSFNRAPTQKVLKTLEKWYDVKVESKGSRIPDFFFTGKITSETKIETVLKIMQFQCDELHLNYDAGNKVITVLP